jgi:hypothetical protein
MSSRSRMNSHRFAVSSLIPDLTHDGLVLFCRMKPVVCCLTRCYPPLSTTA